VEPRDIRSDVKNGTSLGGREGSKEPLFPRWKTIKREESLATGGNVIGLEVRTLAAKE